MNAPPDGSAALQPDTAGVSLWRRASNFEKGIYANIWRWIKRRPDEGAPGSVSFTYVEIVRATIWLWIGASALEMVAVHFVVPWPWLRWPLLIVSVWGLIWMLGFLAGQLMYPHLVEPQQLRVRNGHTVDATVPISAIESIRTVVRSRPSSKTITLDDQDPQHLHIAVSGQVNIHVTLSQPVQVSLPRGRYTITTLSFWADEPAPAVQRLRTLMRERGPRQGHGPRPVS